MWILGLKGLTELFLSDILVISYRTCLPSISSHKSMVPIEIPPEGP